MTQPLLLVVDGGATKTAVSLRNLDNQVLLELQSTSSNYQAIGEQQAYTVLHELLSKVAWALNDTQTIKAAVFALAGIDTDLDSEIARNIAKRALQDNNLCVEQLIVENDAEATMLGAVGSAKGALMIAGTGAIIYGHDGHGNVYRSGGWGHRAGDEGSGYWIGREILRAIFRMEDERGKQTLLKQLVLNKLSISHVDELMQWLFRPNYTNAQIASLTSCLIEATNACDAVAISIAKHAADELILLASSLLKKLATNDDTMTLYLNGGVLTNNPIIAERVRDVLTSQFPNLQILTCTEAPIDYIAKRALSAL